MKKIVLASLLITASLVSAQQVSSITGSGASFPFPLYTEMFNAYKTTASVSVNYASKGSGGGKRDIIARTVDFAGSDAPFSASEQKDAPAEVAFVPMALGAVVPTFNLPGVTTKLKFTGILLADIYMGKIKKWNDTAIASINKGVKLPDLIITPVYRSDGSGTTSIWVDFLAKASSEWATNISKGPQSSVKFPVGVGGPQNAGVAGLVRQTPGSIGYVEVTYAKANKLEYGLVRNKTGKFVDGGDLKEVAVASDADVLPASGIASITNSGIGYPISGYTWILLYKDQKYGSRTQAQAQALVDLVKWMLSNKGQEFHEKLDYGRIDGQAAKVANRIVASINYGGTALK
jgi:phosphate transport system substrate-binding protein